MDVDIVAEAIREAEAATIAPRFRALTDDDVAFKGPDDPVTIADRACEAMLGASLRMIDDLPVVGEEAAAADPSLLAPQTMTPGSSTLSTARKTCERLGRLRRDGRQGAQR